MGIQQKIKFSIVLALYSQNFIFCMNQAEHKKNQHPNIANQANRKSNQPPLKEDELAIQQEQDYAAAKIQALWKRFKVGSIHKVIQKMRTYGFHNTYHESNLSSPNKPNENRYQDALTVWNSQNDCDKAYTHLRSVKKENVLVPGISKQFCAYPDTKPNSTIHLFSIHGTYTNGLEFGLQEDGSSRSIHAFTQQLARDQNAHVTLHILEWTGALSEADRKAGGEKLAVCIKFIKNHDPQARIWTISHSHGGNVTNWAAHSLHLSNDGPIEHAIMLAAPEFDILPQEKSNIEHLTHLEGTVDVTAHLGSMQTNIKRIMTNIFKRMYNWTFGIFTKNFEYQKRERISSIVKPYSNDPNETVQNINISLNQCPLDHVNIKNSLQFLPQILYCAYKRFYGHHHISINISGKAIPQQDQAVQENNSPKASLFQKRLQNRLEFMGKVNKTQSSRTPKTIIEQEIQKQAGKKVQEYQQTALHKLTTKASLVRKALAENKSARGIISPHHRSSIIAYPKIQSTQSLSSDTNSNDTD